MFTRLQNLSNRAVLLILFLLFAGGSLWSLLINLTKPNGDFADWGEGWLQNFSTEMLGAFLTFMLLTLVVSNRQEKERLIRQLRSQVNEVALQAAEELVSRRWLRDGSLKEANLKEANLEGANLEGANLRGANLAFANLQGANLRVANLQGAYLFQANLQGTILTATDLQGARLFQANLQGAQLRYVMLEGASLWGANLQGVHLTGVHFDEKTVLPDGQMVEQIVDLFTPESYYQPGVTDMARYTDPNHPDFWQPEWVKKQQASDSAK